MDNQKGSCQLKQPIHCGSAAFVQEHIDKLNYLFTRERRGQKKPEKRIGRLYHRIVPFGKGNRKNLGITAIGRLFCHRSGLCKIFSSTYIVMRILAE